MRVSVAGASGVLGRRVVPRLIERGHHVTVLQRGTRHEAWFRHLGCVCVFGDLLQPASLPHLVGTSDAVLHLATAVPRPGSGTPPDWSANDRLRRTGTENLLRACRQAGVSCYVQQSIALLHVTSDSVMGDEDSPLVPTAMSRSAADMEDAVRHSGLDWRILRGGAFYGSDTGRDEAWRYLARRGALRLPGAGNDFISLIHVSDMAWATVLATEADCGELALIVVDDEPVTYRELYHYIAALESAAPPAAGGPTERPSFRLSNLRARERLGWQPHFPTYRSGLANEGLAERAREDRQERAVPAK